MSTGLQNNSSLPFRQVALKFCLPGQVLTCSCFDLVRRGRI